MRFLFCLAVLFMVGAPNDAAAAVAFFTAIFLAVRIFNEPTQSERRERTERLRREMEARTRKFEEEAQELRYAREEIFDELRRRMEEARLEVESMRRQRVRANGNHLSTELKHLNLTAMPRNKTELKRAWRKAMSDAHPDKPNGSTEAAQNVNAAYDKLLKYLPAEEK